jgi:hypothetical protein
MMVLGDDDNSRNRLVMEGSSKNHDKEVIGHSKDDTVKIIHTSIELLNSIIRRNMFASFGSLCRIKSFSVQSVCTTITLSTTMLDPSKVGSHIHKQVRYAEIPINYESRATWAAVFELVAYLFISLREQEAALETVKTLESLQSNDLDRAANVPENNMH